MTEAANMRYGREFGKGTLLGDTGIEFFNQPIEQQVREMGWSHACPVIDQVAKEYGPEWTLHRYAECNFVFGLIAESAKNLNPNLHIQLTHAVGRLPDEPVGVITKFTPESHKTKMSPLSTPWGYALPRVVIEQMGRGEGNKDRTQTRVLSSLDIIEKAVKNSTNPIELVVKISETVSNTDADPKAVLSHLLCAGVLQEENCITMFKDIVSEMKKSAPMLTKTYEGMSSEDRKKLGVVDF
jgi:hypothetical protein